MRIIVCETGKKPTVAALEHSLENMQKFVGGLLECVSLAPGIDLWCNEEGRVHGFPPNRIVKADFGHVDICGDFFIAASDEEGETKGLTDKEALYWLRQMERSPAAFDHLRAH